MSIFGGISNALFGKAKKAEAGDSNDYNYGGSKEYADEFRKHLQGRSDAAYGRQAYQLDRSAVNNAMAGFNAGVRGQEGALRGQQSAMMGQSGALANEAQARGEQQRALGMYRDAAMGNAPSVAAAQQQQGLEDASRTGQNLAAGAIGGNPLLAANNAAAVSADAARRSTTDASMMRAQEIADARQGYAGLSGQMRQGDLARGDAYLQRGSQMLQRGDAYLQQGQGALAAGQFAFGAEQAQGQMNQQQFAQNDAQQLAYDNLTAQMNRDALAGRMGYGNSVAQASAATAAGSLQDRAQNQQAATALFKGVGGAVAGSGAGG